MKILPLKINWSSNIYGRAFEKIVQNETEAISQGAYDDSIYNSPNLGMMVVMMGVREA